MHKEKGAMMHKPFTTTEQQIQILKRRNIKFSNEGIAKRRLQREGYYSIINGYKDPFLVNESANAKEDKFKEGTEFEDIYQLFKFDRELRSTIFIATTKAEAVLRTTCAYHFTKKYPNIKNAYLDSSYYNPKAKVHGLIADFHRIIANNSPATKHPERIKSYIQHCITRHDGEVPLWVLSNNLTLGQTTWFFKSQTKDVRGEIAQTYTKLYNQSHKTPITIDSKKLDSVYTRIREFRNICAHDERLYCAQPLTANEKVFQLIKDFNLIIDKSEYLEFLKKIEALLTNLCKKTSKNPYCFNHVLKQMGIDNMDNYKQWYEKAREPKKH
ncbi:Abi family protein [Alloscardovia theropitheci]|uniref:Abi family protein n=1 Tax=Alloscardovia theropitheci TaxID=2496842 RepID=A0A4V2MTZ5_9BIFI|nr:Abi family protein [Alloscardovia theropitheci]TCD54419.1 Abi family protein [Alloscardovia theropitheci]